MRRTTQAQLRGVEVTDYQGFWSYVHKDDMAEGGRIAELARDLVAQFELLTGEPIRLFLDRDEIEWGEQWRAKIDTGLSSVAFFVPVLTPRYFQSAECRRELHIFAQEAKDLGVRDLVLPLLYVDVPDLEDTESDDALIRLVQEFQWVDWRNLRFQDRNAADYRSAVADLAARLVAANTKAEVLALQQSDSAAPPQNDEPDVDAPGILELIAEAEDAYPQLNNTLHEVSATIQEFGDAAQNAAADVGKANERGEGVRSRIRVAKSMAHQIREPASRLQTLGSKYTGQLHTVDGGIRALISLVGEAEDLSEENRQAACDLFESLAVLDNNAQESLDNVQEMVNAAQQLERFSRDLRPPLRKMRQGLTSLLEGRSVITEWTKLAGETGIECDDDGEDEAS